MRKNKNSLTKSFLYAFRGIAESIVIERNMFIHVLVMVLVILMGLFLEISLNEWYWCIILFCLVLCLELVNTALENALDALGNSYDEKIRIAKDCAAGAVLIVAITSVIIGLMIFLPKIVTLIS